MTGSADFARNFHFAKQKKRKKQNKNVTAAQTNKEPPLLHAGNGTIFDSLQSDKDFLPH